MIRFFALMLALLLVSPAAVPASRTGDSAVDNVAAVMAVLDEGVPPRMTQAGIPAVAIAVVRGGRLVATRVYGERAPGKPADAATVFNVASLTKPVFATLVMTLVADGTLALDEPLHRHWIDPDVAEDARHRRLTPRRLLSHQGGFRNWRGREPLRFDFDPGTRHEYSGEGFEYLRRALEHKTGSDLATLMRARVVEPAGMEAWFGWDDVIAGRVAVGFDELGTPLASSTLTGRKANAAANLFTTVAGYGRFMAWIANAALPAEIFDEAIQPQAQHAHPAEAFGLGWKLIHIGGATRALWHDGREAGVRSFALLRPDTRDGLVVLSNSANGELIVRWILEKALPEGGALARQMDGEVWRYLHSLRGPALHQVMETIIASPSFMAMYLRAIDTSLVRSSVDPATAAAGDTDASILALALAMRSGLADSAQVRRLAELGLQDDPGGKRLHDRFDPAQRQAWLRALGEATTKAARRIKPASAPSTVPGEVAAMLADGTLADYAGDYLVPSSQLRVRIRVGEGVLVVTADGTPEAVFHPISATRFAMQEAATEFEFQRDGDGRISGVRIVWNRARSEFAPRLP